MYARKYRAWIVQVKAVENEWRERLLMMGATAIIALDELDGLKKKYEKRRYWTHPLWQLRTDHGFYEAIFPTICNFPEKFENYFRVSRTQFEELLCRVGPMISKEYVVREPISAGARLALTLR